MSSEEGYLNNQVFVHKRDENENILPVDVDIPEMEGKVKILPMPKGEIAKLQEEMKGGNNITTEEQDKALIKKHVIEPTFTDEDFKSFKALEYGYLTTAILVGSGIPRDKLMEASKAIMEKVNPQ